MSDLEMTRGERRDVEAANRTGRPAVVLIHGLWTLPSSWDAWRGFFAAHGYSVVVPSWPGDPDTVGEARRHPEALAGLGLGAVTDHLAGVVRRLDRRPALVGHSFGGLLAQKLAGMGLAAASVAIDPAPIKGVGALPWSTLIPTDQGSTAKGAMSSAHQW